MGYVVESFHSFLNSGNLSLVKNIQQETANKFGCEMQYFTHEIEGYKRITTKCDSIHVAHFGTDSFDNVLQYVREIRRQRNYQIDCVYNDDGPIGILYASTRYLKRLDRNLSHTIKKTLSKNDSDIIKIKNAIKGRPFNKVDLFSHRVVCDSS